ncbi:MAG: hypothetical protein ACREA3_09760 [Nitrosotalea sp.]
MKMEIPNQICEWTEREINRGTHPAKVLLELGSMVLKLYKNQKKLMAWNKKKYQPFLRSNPQETAPKK